jgi:hypothetical protein
VRRNYLDYFFEARVCCRSLQKRDEMVFEDLNEDFDGDLIFVGDSSRIRDIQNYVIYSIPASRVWYQ